MVKCKEKYTSIYIIFHFVFLLNYFTHSHQIKHHIYTLSTMYLSSTLKEHSEYPDTAAAPSSSTIAAAVADDDDDGVVFAFSFL